VDRKILLVDEWRAVRLLGRRVVNSLGLQTCEAPNARAAWEILDAEPEIPAVLLEWRPEDRDCVDLLQKLTQSPRQSRPAVIVCGDTLDRTQIAAALQAGADEFIQKPYSRDIVREKLEQLGILELAESHPIKSLPSGL
jgi:two-component system chemotaxis response regulator CheY